MLLLLTALCHGSIPKSILTCSRVAHVRPVRELIETLRDRTTFTHTAGGTVDVKRLADTNHVAAPMFGLHCM